MATINYHNHICDKCGNPLDKKETKDGWIMECDECKWKLEFEDGNKNK